MSEPSKPTTTASTIRLRYEQAFIKKCHNWLAAGYSTLDAKAFHKAQEPAITGELVRAMKEVQLGSAAPTWMLRMYVADNPPVNAPGRLGKQRRLVDIEFERCERGKRFRFQFEAKRLYRSDSVTEYLGADGLGRFVAGEYGRDDRCGGMIGYVQIESSEIWLAKICQACVTSRDQLRITNDGDMTDSALVPELPHTHRSIHHRPSVGRPILIYHSFLLFMKSV